MNTGCLFSGFWLACAMCPLFTGLRGYYSRKPFLMYSRWALIPFLLLLAGCVLTLKTSGGLSIGLAVSIVLAVAMWFVFPDYTAFGVTTASFREGLLFSLSKLNLAYEETPAGLRLPTIGADLLVIAAENEKWGVGSLRVKPWYFQRQLRDIAREMNAHYRGSTVNVNMRTFAYNFVMSGFFALMAIMLAYIRSL